MHDQIGPYRILQVISAGGMGEVFLAEQEEPIRRKVALKIIRRGLESKAIIARFESERQALAMMDHPCIARVFDAGTTEDGLPYFAMEYVKGQPITEYCDSHRLSTKDRLELIVKVCEGLQHAHQKAVIHRDIKPSNILVTEESDRPVPKIIDFGVAKALEHRLTDKTLHTELGQIVGTPDYMSPEQAQLTGDNIDTRTDVYSVGVLLYELLVGVLPMDPTEVRSSGVEEMLRRIREDDPVRPSTRLQSSVQNSKATAECRRTSSHRLVSQLRGDLDWITMKALEKDRARRYRSATELADDILRYLGNEPVSAGPPSALYRTSKFVRRHRVGVGVTAIAFVFLGALATTTTVQAANTARQRDLAEREAEKAQRISEFLLGLFEHSSPTKAKGEEVTAREILDEGARQIEELEDQPIMQATLMETMGSVYTVMGLFPEARPLLERAVQIREAHEDEDRRALAVSLTNLGTLYDTMAEFEQALPLVERSVEIWEREAPRDKAFTESLNTLGNVFWHLGRMEEAEEVHRCALELREELYGRDHEIIGDSLHNLASLHLLTGRLETAEEYYRRSIDLKERLRGVDDPGLATSVHTLSIVYFELGRLDEALRLQERALAAREKVMGPDHWHTALSLTTLGNIHRERGEPALSVEPVRRAIAIADAAWGPAKHEGAWMRRSLAKAHNALGDYDKAEKALDELLELAASEDATPATLNLLGETYFLQGRYAEARAIHERALEIIERADEADGQDAGIAHAGLARLWHQEGQAAQAEAAFLRGIERMEGGWARTDLRRMKRDYAELLREAGRGDEADAIER